MCTKQEANKPQATTPTMFFQPRHNIGLEPETIDPLCEKAFGSEADKNETEHTKNTSAWD